MTTRYNIPLVVISIAILFFGPAGICAANHGANSLSHPCCQKTGVPLKHTSTLRSCCGDRQPLASSLPAFMDQGQISEAYGVITPASLNVLDHRVPQADSIIFASDHIFLRFHQLLV